MKVFMLFPYYIINHAFSFEEKPQGNPIADFSSLKLSVYSGYYLLILSFFLFLTSLFLSDTVISGYLPAWVFFFLYAALIRLGLYNLFGFPSVKFGSVLAMTMKTGIFPALGGFLSSVMSVFMHPWPVVYFFLSLSIIFIFLIFESILHVRELIQHQKAGFVQSIIIWISPFLSLLILFQFISFVFLFSGRH